MTASYGSASAAGVASTVADVAVAKPTGVVADQLLLAICWAANTTATWSAPAGWTLVAQDTATARAVFARTTDGTEGASFTFTRSVTTGAAGVVMVRVVNAGTVQAVSLNTNTVVTLSTVTAAANNLLLQVVNSAVASANSWTPPASATQRVSGTATGFAFPFTVGDEVVGAGNTGTRTWTQSVGGSSRGAMLAINPRPTQTIAPSAVASTAAVGAPTVTPGSVQITPDGIPAGSTVGALTVQPGAVDVTPASIESTAVIGDATVTATATINTDGIDPTTTVGDATVIPQPVTVNPDGIEPTSRVGDPLVLTGQKVVSLPSVEPTTAVGNPTVTPGSVTASPAGIPSGASAGTPTLHTRVIIAPAGIGSTLDVGAPEVMFATSTISPAGIASTATLGDPTVGVPIRPDECWPVDLSCVPHWDDVTYGDPPQPVYSEAQKQRAIALGIDALRQLTGYRVGGCPTILRPCRPGCSTPNWRTYPVAGQPGGVGWQPVLVSGQWLNIGCGCSTSNCGCTSISEVVLPQPIGNISEVKIDGAVLPSSSYRLDPGGRLIRTDGGRWPICQDIAAPDTVEGTWSVTVRPGIEPDATAQFLAGVMAGEFLRACTGGDCRFPAAVTQIARLGVTMQLGTGAFPEGRTGIREVDVWLDRWNPTRLRTRATVLSPDTRRPRQQGR